MQKLNLVTASVYKIGSPLHTGERITLSSFTIDLHKVLEAYCDRLNLDTGDVYAYEILSKEVASFRNDR